MATFSITSNKTKSLAALFNKAPEITERWTQNAVNASIQEVFRHATQENLPWRTGRLTRSFGEGIEIGRLYGSIGPTVEYAPAVHEKSSKPHFMPRLMELAKPRIEELFGEALDGVVDELAHA
jgi:hypothetical protein